MICRSRVACYSVLWLTTFVLSAFSDEPKEYEITDADREHWSFRPVARSAVPTVKNRDWVRTPIDAFILAKLEQASWQPNRRAERRDLLRRVTLDLTGLPQAIRPRGIDPAPQWSAASRSGRASLVATDRGVLPDDLAANSLVQVSPR